MYFSLCAINMNKLYVAVALAVFTTTFRSASCVDETKVTNKINTTHVKKHVAHIENKSKPAKHKPKTTPKHAKPPLKHAKSKPAKHKTTPPSKHPNTLPPSSRPTLQQFYGMTKVTNSRQQKLSDIIGEIGAGDFSSHDLSKSIPAIRQAANQALSLVDAEIADLKNGKPPNGPGMLGKPDLIALAGVFGNLRVELGTELETGQHTTQQINDANKLLTTLTNGEVSVGTAFSDD